MTSTQQGCNSSAVTVPAWHISKKTAPQQDISLQAQSLARYVLSNHVLTPRLRMQFPKLIHLRDRKHLPMFRCNFSCLISSPSSQWNYQETLNTLPPPLKFLQAVKSPFYSCSRPFPTDFSSLLPISGVSLHLQQLYGVQEITQALFLGERSDPDGACLQMSPCTRPVCEQQHAQPPPPQSARSGSSLTHALGLTFAINLYDSSKNNLQPLSSSLASSPSPQSPLLLPLVGSELLLQH